MIKKWNTSGPRSLKKEPYNNLHLLSLEHVNGLHVSCLFFTDLYAVIAALCISFIFNGYMIRLYVKFDILYITFTIHFTYKCIKIAYNEFIVSENVIERIDTIICLRIIRYTIYETTRMIYRYL